jgi:DNA-binding NarL/FixJ family response regulator
MKETINILIVEDHLSFAQGMELLLTQHPKVDTIHISTNRKDALEILSVQSIDIVILDLHFETKDYDGFIIAKKIKQLYPAIKIMILTQHAKKAHHKRLFEECKVDAYLDKKLGVEETFYAIDQVMNDEKYIDESIKEMLEIEGFMNISDREKEVLELLCQGFIHKEIAEKLFIVHKTVEVHVRNLRQKFDVKNSAELCAKYAKYKNANRDNIDDTTSPFQK